MSTEYQVTLYPIVQSEQDFASSNNTPPEIVSPSGLGWNLINTSLGSKFVYCFWSRSTNNITVTEDYIIVDNIDIILANASTNVVTITLPDPSEYRKITVKKIDSSSNNVIIDALTNLIDGNQTYEIVNQYESITIVSDGNDWFVI